MYEINTLGTAEVHSHSGASLLSLPAQEQQLSRAPCPLPFTVRLVDNTESLKKAVALRASAYARHVADLAAKLVEPEEMDTAPGVAVFLAESKEDGSAIGTMRIQANSYQPLALERSLPLPSWLQGKVLAEATRLGVTQKAIGRVAKVAMFKCYYQYCVAMRIDWMVIAARAPLDRQYDALMLRDVYPDLGYVPLCHANDIPHRVMALDVAAAERTWRAAGMRALDFFVDTYHPDLFTESFMSIQGSA